ncbi:MAG: hypothetical protein AB8H47_10835 [Bacteroidia bacterium]
MLPLIGNAQTDDITTRLGYLPQWQFHNELEMQNWPKLLAGEEIDPETLFLMTLPAVSSSRLGIYRERLEALYQSLDKKGFASKSHMAQAKMLQKILYKDYFKQYEYLSGLDQLFDKGGFNCLTASTLSALVMEHFQVPYQLKEHDNVITIEIGSGSVIVSMATQEETQGPLGYTPDNNLMESTFVAFLESLNIVSEQEQKLYDDKQLFHKHLMGQGNLSFRELVGLHYMSQVYLAFIAEKREIALSLMEKAFVFFPEGERVAYWILNERMGIYKIENWGREGIMEDFRTTTNMLSIYSEAPTLNMELFSLGYESILETVLYDKYQPQKAEDFHRYLLEDLPNEEIREQAEMMFTTKMALGHQKNQAYDAALPYILKANQNDPDFRAHKLLLLENARARFMNAPKARQENYKTYMAATPHDSVKRELRGLYLSLNLQEMAQQGDGADLENALSILEELYLLKPQIAELRYNYRNFVRVSVNKGEMGEAYMGHLLHLQDSLINLGKGDQLAPMLCETVLLNVRNKFRANELSLGVLYLNTFKADIGKRFDIPDEDFDPFVNDAYWEYAAYYIRKVNYKKARAVLEEARQYLTDDGFIDEQINKVLIPLGG